MEITLARFVHALRSADLEVSPAETLDAFAVVRTVGLADPRLLENALSLTLAKSIEEKARFAECFERFFHQLAFRDPPRRAMLREASVDALLAAVEATGHAPLRTVVQDILRGDRSELAWRVQAEAEHLDLAQMTTLRDKARLIDSLGRALGVPELERLIAAHSATPSAVPAELAALRYLRQYVQEQVRGYVDVQYQLNVDASGKRALLAAALAGNLDRLPPDYYAEVDRVVAKLADRLARQHRRRARRNRGGHLDLKRTLRHNVAYDGAFFKLYWRRRFREPSAVFVVCDVSNSVARLSRFLLLFLHGLADALPHVRVFAFSNRLGEITESFRRDNVHQAVEEALFDWGKGATDYGRALADFRELVQADLDHHSTLIFLGDARGNFFDPRTDILKALAQRVRQVFWLNPESRDRWGEGDSAMHRYAPYCQRVDVCRDLGDIERFADRLLTATR